MVFERSISGDIYNSEASPLCTRSMASERDIGSSNPLMVTASVMPRSARLSTWSFMSDCKGDITTVSPRTLPPSINAGSWNVSDLPPPVGNIANSEFPSMAARAAFSCNGSPSYVRNES